METRISLQTRSIVELWVHESDPISVYKIKNSKLLTSASGLHTYSHTCACEHIYTHEYHTSMKNLKARWQNVCSSCVVSQVKAQYHTWENYVGYNYVSYLNAAFGEVTFLGSDKEAEHVGLYFLVTNRTKLVIFPIICQVTFTVAGNCCQWLSFQESATLWVVVGLSGEA